MPRGRHRHSPPLHRLLPPSAIAGVSLVCASAPWVFSQPMVLRALAAAAALTAVVGAVVMRRWDTHAGKRVADLTRARTGDEWRHEERVAELESDLEESRELRAKLEQRLRAKRAELAGLRNEHASLLRRYATAQTERASALEGRRLLELEAAPTRALPPVADAGRERAVPAPRVADAPRAVEPGGGVAGAVESGGGASGVVESGAGVSGAGLSGVGVSGARAVGSGKEVRTPGPRAVSGNEGKPAPTVFSREGSELYRRAQAALSRLAGDDALTRPASGAGEPVEAAEVAEVAKAAGSGGSVGSVSGSEPQAAPKGERGERGRGDVTPTDAEARPVVVGSEHGEQIEEGAGHCVPQDEAPGQSEAVAVQQEHTAAGTTPAPATAAHPVQRPSGHYTVPTAVAVVPAAPVRRPAVEGGFDFFGTRKVLPPAPLDAVQAAQAVQAVQSMRAMQSSMAAGQAASQAAQSVQDEDLADVVGPEALALHAAESEAEVGPEALALHAAESEAEVGPEAGADPEFPPSGAQTRDADEVIDLTAHDETEQIDVQGLRTAAS